MRFDNLWYALVVLLLLGSVPRAQAAGWQVVFNEDFSGPALNRQVWSTRYIYENELCDSFPKNGEKQRYRDNDNHVFKDGKLGLVARRVKPEGEYSYESGLLRSYQTFYYGYFEARVKAPSAKGTWPAFWLAADSDRDGNIEWPPEIDIFDNANNGKDATSSTVYSGGVTSKEISTPVQGGKVLYVDKLVDKERIYQSGIDLTADYHVYGLLWTPTQISMWLDGKHIYTQAYRWVDNDGKLAGPAHVLFNLAVGGPWAGRFGIDEQAFPQTFQVDYVRVCQLDPSKKATSRTCGDSKQTPDPIKYAYQTNGAGNDMARPTLYDATLSKQALQVGDSLDVTHRISSAVSTKQKHDVYQYVVNARGETVLWTKLPSPTPSTQWAGRSIRLKTKLPIPRDTPPGKYRIYLAVGTAESWDPEGKTSLHALTLQYAPGTKHRERAGQPLRYKVGEFSVVR